MQYDMVFEGGGAKGMAFVGAMEALAVAGHAPARLVGTSAGAITATTLAVGYTDREMMAALSERDGQRPVFATFLGDPPPPPESVLANGETVELLRAIDMPFVPDSVESKVVPRLVAAMAGDPRWRRLVTFIESGGFYSADSFVAWLSRKLDQGAFRGRPRGFSRMTLAELHTATGVDLTLTASDTTAGRLLVLNHRTAPRLPVVMAARMSMSVPLLWEEVVWRPAWGQYRGRDIAGHVVVDGGLLSNFPIELLISREKPVLEVMGEATAASVMGFLIDETLPVPGAPPNAETLDKLSSLGTLSVARRLRALVDTVTQARDKMVIDEFETLVVRLPAKGYGTTEFDMDETRKAAIIQAAERATAAHLAGLDRGTLEVLGGPVDDFAAAKADRLARRLLEE